MQAFELMLEVYKKLFRGVQKKEVMYIEVGILIDECIHNRVKGASIFTQESLYDLRSLEQLCDMCPLAFRVVSGLKPKNPCSAGQLADQFVDGRCSFRRGVA